MFNSNIHIYKTEDGQSEISVKLENETVWLNLNQLVELFNRDKSLISSNINNLFKEKELEKTATVANFATVQNEGGRIVERKIEYFNLDIIISVGYRIKSSRGTHFRIWANKILKEYLIKGYSLNERKLKELKEQNDQLKELLKSITILGNVLAFKPLDSDESTGLLSIISNYAHALEILDRYDYQNLEIDNTSCKETYQLNYEEAIRQIQIAKKENGISELFENEKDDSFKSSISTIYQTFEGLDLYPSIEEKAANLLYFITKNHSFSDGNKRITDNTLVALTLSDSSKQARRKRNNDPGNC